MIDTTLMLQQALLDLVRAIVAAIRAVVAVLVGLGWRLLTSC